MLLLFGNFFVADVKLWFAGNDRKGAWASVRWEVVAQLLGECFRSGRSSSIPCRGKATCDPGGTLLCPALPSHTAGSACCIVPCPQIINLVFVLGEFLSLLINTLSLLGDDVVLHRQLFLE